MKYIVQKGDTLWAISRRYLGKGAKWRKLYHINRDIIGSDPDLILPGQVLEIPIKSPFWSQQKHSL